MPKIPLSALRNRSIHRHPKYLQEIISNGRLIDDHIELEDKIYKDFLIKYNPSYRESMRLAKPENAEDPVIPPHVEEPEPPTYKDMATNFVKAFSTWTAAGFPVVSKETFDKRMEICRACKFWDNDARGGLGKCNQSSCGCTKVKFWLATEKCPILNWDKQI